MDDTTLRNLETKLRYLRSLQERREEGAPRHGKPGKLTPSGGPWKLPGPWRRWEDLYRPYRPRRRTRATVA